MHTIVKHSQPTPIPLPNDEQVAYQNAIAKEYPFCYYYKERNNDPL